MSEVLWLSLFFRPVRYIKRESLSFLGASAYLCAFQCCECQSTLTFVQCWSLVIDILKTESKIMDGRSALCQDPAFVKLKEYFDQHGQSLNIANLFKEDSQRFSKFRWGSPWQRSLAIFCIIFYFLCFTKWLFQKLGYYICEMIFVFFSSKIFIFIAVDYYLFTLFTIIK